MTSIRFTAGSHGNPAPIANPVGDGRSIAAALCIPSEKLNYRMEIKLRAQVRRAKMVGHDCQSGSDMTRNPHEHDITCGALDPWPTACDCGCDAPALAAEAARPNQPATWQRENTWRKSLRAFFARLNGQTA